MARADTEAIARRQAEELTADLEKDKAIRELEVEDNERRLLAELNNKDEIINSYTIKESESNKTIEIISKEKEDLSAKLHYMNQGLASALDSFNSLLICFPEMNNYINQSVHNDKVEQLSKQLQQEKLLKQQVCISRMR